MAESGGNVLPPAAISILTHSSLIKALELATLAHRSALSLGPFVRLPGRRSRLGRLTLKRGGSEGRRHSHIFDLAAKAQTESIEDVEPGKDFPHARLPERLMLRQSCYVTHSRAQKAGSRCMHSEDVEPGKRAEGR
jgi:hypothetical protein